jgi:hypothetical protein
LSYWIESQYMKVGVTPENGSRVTHVISKETGKDWIAQPAVFEGSSGAEAYGGGDAFGWEECFPTVVGWDASHTNWGRELRDQGDLWGKPWSVALHNAVCLKTVFSHKQYRFERTLAISDRVLGSNYELTNCCGLALPFIWASHGLLSVCPQDRICVPGIDQVDLTYLAPAGRMKLPAGLSWPHAGNALSFSLDRVQAADRRMALKIFAEKTLHYAQVESDGEILQLSWHPPFDSLGIWLNYGGWPSKNGLHHIALEPTNTSTDCLGEAISSGTAITLEADSTIQWSTRLEFVSNRHW